MLPFFLLQRKVKGVQCDLREHMTDPTLDPAHSPGPVTQFQSVSNADWFVGFNRRGQRLHGAKWKKTDGGEKSLRHLYSFVKVTVEANARDSHRDRHGPMASVGGDHSARRDFFEKVRSKT